MFLVTVTSDTRPRANHAGECSSVHPVTGCLRCGYAYNDATSSEAMVYSNDGSPRVPPKFVLPRERGRWWERR